MRGTTLHCSPYPVHCCVLFFPHHFISSSYIAERSPRLASLDAPTSIPAYIHQPRLAHPCSIIRSTLSPYFLEYEVASAFLLCLMPVLSLSLSLFLFLCSKTNNLCPSDLATLPTHPPLSSHHLFTLVRFISYLAYTFPFLILSSIHYLYSLLLFLKPLRLIEAQSGQFYSSFIRTFLRDRVSER